MDFVGYYYSSLGELPCEDSIKKTALTIDYLKDCGYNEHQILKILDSISKEFISKKDLPDALWENSLIRRESFYYHSELRVLPPPPSWDSDYKHYLEMKIMYTESMALDYFKLRFKLREELFNEKKEIGALKFLLSEYSKIKVGENIDFFLYLCDYAYNNNIKVTSIYGLRDCEADALDAFEQEINHAIFVGNDKIIDREE